MELIITQTVCILSVRPGVPGYQKAKKLRLRPLKVS